MTDSIALRKKIDDSGLKLKFIADNLGLSPFGFSRKVNNDTEFKASEIQKLSELLRLTAKERDAIFFNLNVD